MLTLYQIPPAFDLPVSVSPYCAKLELYLRLTGREYRTATCDFRAAPNGQVPYVQWEDGSIEDDTGNIIAKLETRGPRLDARLSSSQRIHGENLENLAQDTIYFACLYSRFVDPDGWRFQKPTVRALVPTVLAPVLLPVVRNAQRKRCLENGFVDDAAGYLRAAEAVQTIASELGDQPYILGDEPHTADCALWATLLQGATTLAPSPIRSAIRQQPGLLGYIERLGEHAGLALAPGRLNATLGTV